MGAGHSLQNRRSQLSLARSHDVAQVMRSQRSMAACYDASDEVDMSFLLGIG